MSCGHEFFVYESGSAPLHNGMREADVVRSVALTLKACRATPEQVEAMDEDQWSLAARAVGVKRLAMRSRESVVAELGNMLKRRPHAMRNVRRT